MLSEINEIMLSSQNETNKYSFCQCHLFCLSLVRRWTLTWPRTTWTWWWRTLPWWRYCLASRREKPSLDFITTPTRWRTEPGERNATSGRSISGIGRSASVVTLMLRVSQRPGVPQAGPDDRGLWEPLEEDDGGICPAWKGRRKKKVKVQQLLCLHHLSMSPLFSKCRLLLKSAKQTLSGLQDDFHHAL